MKMNSGWTARRDDNVEEEINDSVVDEDDDHYRHRSLDDNIENNSLLKV